MFENFKALYTKIIFVFHLFVFLKTRGIAHWCSTYLGHRSNLQDGAKTHY